MSKRQAFLLWCGILFFASVPGAVQGAAIQWRDLVPMAPPEVSGKVVEAVNLAGGAVVVGGVSFQAGDATAPAPLHSNLFKVLTSVWAGPTGAATGNADLDLMLRGGRWIAGTAKLTLTFSSLNPGTTYQIQFYIADFRTALQIGRAYHFEDESGHASPVFTRGGKMSVIGTFRADSDLQNIFFVCESGSQDPLLNGYVLSTCVPKGVAFDPDPENRETDVLRDGVLGWTPSEHAQTHDVYFGTVFDDVNSASRTNPRSVLASEGQSTTMYDPGRLAFGTTYYWRVDEVNAPPTSTIVKGETWSFTTEPVAYPVDGQTIIAAASSADAKQGPENTVNGAGLANDLHSNDLPTMWVSAPGLAGPAWIQYELAQPLQLHEMWVWNHDGLMETTLGLGAKDVTIEYSSDGTTFQTLGTTHEFARALGQSDYAHNTTIAFGDVAVKIVKLTIHSNWGGILPQCGLSEVRFFAVPVYARQPNPTVGTAGVAVDATVSWRAGREADQHKVYLSPVQQTVTDGAAPTTTVTTPGYAPSLDLASTYYWRVDEVNEAETPATWPGAVWSFSTQEYLVIDDFESYTDAQGHAIFETWPDGIESPTNGGSQVGNDPPPYAEGTIVHAGKKSMPLFYNNLNATYSETTRRFAEAQDWTQHGIKGLTLWFYGDPNNAAQQMYVKINGTKIPYDGDAANLKRAQWQMWYVDLTGRSVGKVTSISIGLDRLGGSGGLGRLLIDDLRLYSYERSLVTPTVPGTADLAGCWTLDEGSGQTAGDSSGNKNQGTIFGAHWVPGQVNGALSFDGGDDYVEIPDADTLTPANVALAYWIKPGSTSSSNPIAKRDAANKGSYVVQIGATTTNHYCSINGAWPTVAFAYRMDEWQHVAVTYDGSAIRGYLNGGLVKTTAAPGTLNNDAGVLRFGQDPRGGLFYKGLLDDVRLYNRALSDAEVAGLAGRTQPFDKSF